MTGTEIREHLCEDVTFELIANWEDVTSRGRPRGRVLPAGKPGRAKAMMWEKV